MEASSATTGFFQSLPTLRNQFYDDPSIGRILDLFVPKYILSKVKEEIAQLGEDALNPQTFDWCTDAEKNQPYLSGSGKNAFGQPVSSKLVVSEGWRKLQELGFEKGFSAQGYESGLEQYTRVIQYMRSLLWEPSSANTSCPIAMQDGATRLLQRQLSSNKLTPVERKVFQNAYDHLTSRDPKKAWTSGQWMTERPGGSDVSQTETRAIYDPISNAVPCNPEEGIPLGPWRIDGFKWFSSATDSNMTVLLAQTKSGLSAFYAPMRRYNPELINSPSGARGGYELNGVTISRLKNKMGTKSLPTAELELKGMRGWLIGEEGRGIHEISTILTITRLRTATGALGYLGRGLAVARAFAAVREVGVGKGARINLVDHPLHMRTLSDMTIEYHGMMLLLFYSMYVMGLEEHPNSPISPPSSSIAEITPPKELVAPLLRALTSLAKAYCSKRCMILMYACMESLGGVGYLENTETEHLNLARLFRDGCVCSIWEGTTDVLSSDFVRALKHPRGGAESIRALDLLITRAARGRNERILGKWAGIKSLLADNSQAELLSQARDILWNVAEILMGTLYLVDIRGREDPRAAEMCQRYLAGKGFEARAVVTRGADELKTNQHIVFGGTGRQEAKAKL